MVVVVADSELPFNEGGDSLGCPEFSAPAMGHGALGQKANEAGLLPGVQPGWASRSGLGLQRLRPPGAQGIPPAQNAAGMAAYPPGDFMQGQVLLEQGDGLQAPRLQGLGRTEWPHRDTPLKDAPNILL